MRCSCLLLFAALLSAGAAADEPTVPGTAKLWYDEPATTWMEALPLGNGRLGGMVFGGTADERIQFNEDTLWAGGPHDYSHPGAADVLPEIRRLLLEGKQREAEKLAMEKFMSVPLRQVAYQAFGDLRLELPGHEQATNYRRELDLDAAVATVQYDCDGVAYTREALASYPDQVIALRIRAGRSGSIDCNVRFTTLQTNSKSIADGAGATVTLSGQVSPYEFPRSGGQTVEGELTFCAKLKTQVLGGEVSADEGVLQIRKADEVCFYLAAATSYQDYGDISGDPAAKCDAVLEPLAGKTFEVVRERHCRDHRQLYRRMSFDLGTTEASQLPTDERIARFAEGNDPQLAALYFQYGRYLLIACSRPGTQPANLQGLWNDSLSPSWESKYTVNINTEMNYWPAEVCNLSECHKALFDALDEVVESGRRTAKVHYNARGWVLHHNFDLWRGTAPINNSNHGIWPVGGAWLCQHFWWHYQYHLDKAFLRDRAYPILRDASLFFLDTLVKDPRNDKGWLISGPSNSPEQGGLVMGPTMDHQIIRSLLGWTIEASEILDVDAELRKQLAEVRTRIAPNQIGSQGQLQEWLEDVDSPENHHRHFSHMWGVFPGDEIDRQATPDLAAAALKSIQWRGDGPIGWSRAWQVHLFARLGDAETAHDRLVRLIARNSAVNLFDRIWEDRPEPFQIEANLGGSSGIAEMLLQSQLGKIRLLPTLPKAWPSGKIRGLRARGGLEVDLQWQDGRLTEAVLRADTAGTQQLVAPPGYKIAGPATVALKPGESCRVQVAPLK
ncbi:MAG: glycoside hydrolase family 95 protein [Planctomycetaceae bacterium]|nr:glycoside hydrolase family 95 protein [Planctomycetaceae bacterium]